MEAGYLLYAAIKDNIFYLSNTFEFFVKHLHSHYVISILKEKSSKHPGSWDYKPQSFKYGMYNANEPQWVLKIIWAWSSIVVLM